MSVSAISFANNIEEAKITNTCCTATLTYNGQYVDHQESCSAGFTYEQNCAFAQAAVLKRNPAAAIALQKKDVN